jgi:hypothetical protein
MRPEGLARTAEAAAVRPKPLPTHLFRNPRKKHSEYADRDENGTLM